MPFAVKLVLGLFIWSVLVARWESSTASGVWHYLWCEHWQIRRRIREFKSKLYERYPRVMHRWFRAILPFYRVRNKWAWYVWPKLEPLWRSYALLWARMCKKHQVALISGTCLACTLGRIAQAEEVKLLTGRDGHPEFARILERALSRKSS